MSRRAKERIWFALSLLYAVGRIFAANAYLAQYGLNIVTFAIVELTSSVVLAVASAKVVNNLVDKRRVQMFEWMMLVLAGFATPDAYAFLATDHLPKTLVIALATFIVASAIWTTSVIRRDLHTRRDSQSSEE